LRSIRPISVASSCVSRLRHSVVAEPSVTVIIDAPGTRAMVVIVAPLGVLGFGSAKV
jgi:hypothetical protein